MHSTKSRILGGALAAAVAWTGSAVSAAADQVNIYSYRQEALIKPQLDAFSKATGIRYNLITGSAGGLLERLRNEGVNSPADVLFTVDGGNLWRAKEMGVLQPIRSDVLNEHVPAEFRDPDGMWYGLGLRARVIFYHVDKVKPADLSTYEDLADPRWKGQILMRSSSNIYNQSLLAALIHHHGAEKAEAWARGVVANMARRPQGGDTDQLKALAAGEGAIAVANTYYFARLLASDSAADRRVTENIRLFWPNQSDRGAHVNVSGGGVTKSSRNRDNAIRLLEFMVSEEAQKLYAEAGQEFPVRAGISKGDVVASLGEFRMDDLPLSKLGENNPEAVRIFDRVRWR
jgi:iron(III) transport system substrate-binding protein